MKKLGSVLLAAVLSAGALGAAAPAEAAMKTKTVKAKVTLASVKYKNRLYVASATQTFKIRIGGDAPAKSISGYTLAVSYKLPKGFSSKLTKGTPVVTVEDCATIENRKCTVVRTAVDGRVRTNTGRLFTGTMTIVTEVTRKGTTKTWVV